MIRHGRLKVLRDNECAAVRPEVRWRLYAVNFAPLSDVDAWLDSFRRIWAPRPDALSTAVARGERARRDVSRRINAVQRTGGSGTT